MADTAIKREREEFGDDPLSSLHETPSDSQKAKTDDSDKKGQRWTPEQDDALRAAVEKFGQRNWKSIAEEVEGRNHAQCLQRWNKVLKPGLVKGHWSYEEDSILERMVLQGCHSWAEVSAHIPGRTAKQCRERWRNHLDPSINKSPFTHEEDITIQQAYEEMGNRWTQIAELLPGRTEDAIKMRWKALNPNQKNNAKPGRPPLMNGQNSSKVRVPVQANPDLMIATTHGMVGAPPGAPMQQMYGYAAPYDASTSMPIGTMPLGSMPIQQQHVPQYQQHQMHQQQVHQQQMHQQQQTHHQGHFGSNVGSELPEPSVEPLGDDHHQEVDEKDAAMLFDLLRSRSSMLSFGSARGLSSFADMSPDELLASGELDEMLKAVSLVNEGGTASMSSGRKSSSSFRLPPSISSARDLQKAISSFGSQDKHIFQELIEEIRADRAANAGRTSVTHQDLPSDFHAPNDPNLYSSYDTTSSHSLDFDRRPAHANANAGAYEEDDDENDFSDLMKPIHRGKRY